MNQKTKNERGTKMKRDLIKAAKGYLVAKLDGKEVEVEIKTDIKTFNLLCDLLEKIAKAKPESFSHVDEMEILLDDENRLYMEYCD